MLNQITLVHELTESGIDQKQADAIVRVISTSQDSLVTREYLETRLTALEIRIDSKLEGLKSSIVMWVSGILIAQGAAIVALIKLVGGN